MKFSAKEALGIYSLVVCIVAVSSQFATCPPQDTCISIRDCPHLQRRFQSGELNGAEIRKLLCGFGNGQPLLCCPSSSSSSEPPKLPACGMKGLSDLIVNGENAPLKSWPWIVRLRSRSTSDERSSFVCGGVLISERYVLTAAHCLNDREFVLESVRLGEHTANTNPDCENGVCKDVVQDVTVEETIIHEDYGNPSGCSRCNDIALLRLNRPVSLESTDIRSACLPQNFQSDLGFSIEEFPSRTLSIAGWGSTDPSRPSPANILQQATVKVDSSLCPLDLSVYPNQDMVFCAGDPRRTGARQDSCRGDSGGPMVIDISAKTYLVGITSRGPRRCGAARTGGIYTNVNFYIPWIFSNMRP